MQYKVLKFNKKLTNFCFVIFNKLGHVPPKKRFAQKTNRP